MTSRALLLVALAGCAPPPMQVMDGCPTESDDPPEPPRHTPRWAFEPWISKDISDGADTRAFVEGFASRGIPVGAVVLDSPWETHYNTFVPHPKRYPEFARLSEELHGRGIRLVLWITQMVNTSSVDFEEGGDKYEGPSPNYAEGERCGFYVDRAASYVWWKGTGAGVDFENGRARAWWHKQQDAILPLIDGWKLDFGDSYVLGKTVETARGEVSHQRYSESYYRDFLAHGVAKRGREFTTMVRGWDESYGFKGRFHARVEHAPVVWAGDNRRDAVGLADALDTMLRSARAGYVVVGSDLGGYLDFDDRGGGTVAADWEVFARWTAIAALTPFMQLHGRANLAPWTVPDRPGKEGEMVRIYREWSVLHHELVPFFYSLAEEAHAGRAPPIVRPIGDETTWTGDWRYQLGDAFLVAPLVSTATRDVTLPQGARWIDWWDRAAAPIPGGTTLRGYAKASERGRVPLFVREGAIVPLATAGGPSLLVYPGATPSEFALHDQPGAVTRIHASSTGGRSNLAFVPALPVATALRVRAEAAPKDVLVDGKATPFAWDASTHEVTFTVPAGTKLVQ